MTRLSNPRRVVLAVCVLPLLLAASAVWVQWGAWPGIATDVVAVVLGFAIYCRLLPEEAVGT